MTFRKLGLGAFMLLLSICASAQKNFVEGYVVNHSGDTLRGLIDDKNWLGNPHFIRFRKTAGEAPVTYTTGDIVAFHLLSRESYRSKAVMYDVSPVDLARLGESPNPLWQKDTLFLRVELEGKVNLYFFLEENDKPHYFLEKNGAEAEDLLNVQYYADYNGVRKVVATQQYKSQLTNYLADCGALAKKLSAVRYEYTSIRNVVRQYNGCGGRVTQASATPGERVKVIEPGLLLGGHFTKLKFWSEDDLYKDLTTGIYRNTMDGMAGLSVDLVVPRAHRQYVFHNELIYKSYHVSKVFERQPVLGSPYVKANSYFRMSFVQASTMFRYHRATFARIRPYLEAGVTMARTIGVSNSITKETTYSSGGTFRSEATALRETNKATFGLVGGIGATTGNFGLTVRYERLNGPSTLDGLYSSVRSVYLLANYTLR